MKLLTLRFLPRGDGIYRRTIQDNCSGDHSNRNRIICFIFNSDGLKEGWSRYAEIAKAGWVRTEHLSVLADSIQQLYLNLPSYSAWSEQKWQNVSVKVLTRSSFEKS